VYGFGGDERPVRESLKLLSDMVIGYITRVTHEGDFALALCTKEADVKNWVMG